MCQFFSFITFARKPYYFNWEDRQKCLSGELDYRPDSHASIAKFHDLEEDKCNKYEHNPITGLFQVDQINAKRDDSEDAEKWVRRLDWRRVVQPLNIKPIVHPLKVTGTRLCESDKRLLAEWDSVWAGVWAGVYAGVCDSVGASVRASVWASVWVSVRASVRDSVRDSVGTSLCGYISSFFDVKELAKFSAVVKLWDRGFVPSFDGKTWRLHHGPEAKIVYVITATDLRKKNK